LLKHLQRDKSGVCVRKRFSAVLKNSVTVSNHFCYAVHHYLSIFSTGLISFKNPSNESNCQIYFSAASAALHSSQAAAVAFVGVPLRAVDAACHTLR
jgi:hypothetical protein